MRFAPKKAAGVKDLMHVGLVVLFVPLQFAGLSLLHGNCLK